MAPATTTDWYGTAITCRHVTIGALPDNVLLEIFDFYFYELQILPVR